MLVLKNYHAKRRSGSDAFFIAVSTDYVIRMDYTALPSTGLRIDHHNRGVPSNAKQYLTSGFLVCFKLQRTTWLFHVIWAKWISSPFLWTAPWAWRYRPDAVQGSTMCHYACLSHKRSASQHKLAFCLYPSGLLVMHSQIRSISWKGGRFNMVFLWLGLF